MGNSSYTTEKQDKRGEFFMVSSSRKSNPESWKLFTNGTVHFIPDRLNNIHLVL